MDTPRKILEELRQVFTKIAGKDQQIDRSEFKKAMGLKDEYFSERMFAMFDNDKSGFIDIEEFLKTVEELVFATAEEKLKFAYQLHDINGDGSIEKDEISHLIAASLKENNLTFPPEQVIGLVDILFLEADTDKSGEISFEEFKGLIEKHPDLLEAMAVSPVSWLKPRQPDDAIPVLLKEKRSPKAYLKHYIQNNWVKIAFLSLYLVANLVLFFGSIDMQVKTQMCTFKLRGDVAQRSTSTGH